MIDYNEGIKREVAEIKFLIHDLRVEPFINEVIHFHVTLNTDLEIFDVAQAQVLHGADLQELKERAIEVRRAFRDYSNAVRSFSPPDTILAAGKTYIGRIYDLCELILNPLWGRFDKVLTFLPEHARSVRARNHYRNSIRWICGVYYRIEHFLNDLNDANALEYFDIAHDVREFTRHVVYGYVMEKSSSRVELQLQDLESAVIHGNRHRFRRMYFNLVMNAVDAMAAQKFGVLKVDVKRTADNRVCLNVCDTGNGMSEAKIAQLCADKPTLDGELHSLGFVYVRRTIAELDGTLKIRSEIGKGTTVTVCLPFHPDAKPSAQRPSRCQKYEIQVLSGDHAAPGGEQPSPGPTGTATTAVTASAPRAGAADGSNAGVATPSAGGNSAPTSREQCGRLVYEDFVNSKAEHRGSIFIISVTPTNRVDLFSHKPYERHWNISHEDLSPMFYLAATRGRIENDEQLRPVLILKAPQSVSEFFDLKEIPSKERSSERALLMIHDEYIRVARKLIDTGLNEEILTEITDARKYFPDAPYLDSPSPFPLRLMASESILLRPKG